MAPKADLLVGEATLPWGGRRQGGPPPGARAEVLRMAPLVTASVSAGLPGRALQRGNFRKGRSSGLDLDPLRDAPQSQPHLRRLGPGFRANATIGEHSVCSSINVAGARARSRCRRSVIPGATRRRERGSEPTGPPYDAGRVLSAGVSAVRLLVGRGATRNLVSRESRDASPRRVARLVDEQQALPAVPPHDADRRSPSTPRRSPATDGRRKTSGAIPTSRGATAVSRALPRRKPRRGHERPVRRE